MKKNLLTLTWIGIFIWSCQDKNLSTGIENLPKIELTTQEYISIAYDSPGTLSESEAIKFVANFDQFYGITRGKEKNFSIKKKYSIGKKNRELSRSNQNQQTIPMYEISITDGENNGFAIVSADERIAGVLAYIPMITPENELKQRENNLMLELSESSILHRLNYIDSIRTTMRASTLCKLSKKLGISINEIEFEQIKNNITIVEKSIDSRAQPENIKPPSLGQPYIYYIGVDWGQDEPYNLLLPTYPDPDFDWVTYHYPLGCSVTALMMVYSYFEPSIKGYDNGEEMIIDWAYLKENRKIINPEYGVPGDPEKKLRMISRLGFWIYNGTKTTTHLTNSVYQSETARNEIVDDLDTYKIAHDPIKNLNKTKWGDLSKLINDVQDYHIAIMGATRKNAGPNSSTATGNHVWVLDGHGMGYKVISGTTYLFDYLHVNMGWNGSYNGWYYIDTTLSFETGNGDYDTDFWYISKLRKK